MNWLDSLLGIPAICEMLLAEEWTWDFDNRILGRGRRLSEQGRVLEIEHLLATNSLLSARAQVQGTMARPYTVRLSASPQSEGWELSGDCTCPVGADCKHAVAFAFDLRKAIAAARSEIKDELPHHHWLDQLQEISVSTKGAELEHRTADLAYLIDPRESGLLVVSHGKIAYRDDGEAVVENTHFSPAPGQRVPSYFRDGDHDLFVTLRTNLPKINEQDGAWGDQPILSGRLAETLLPDLIATERLFLAEEFRERDGKGIPLRLTLGPPLELSPEWKLTDDGRCLPSVGLPSETAVIVEIQNLFYLDPDRHKIGWVTPVAGMSLDMIRRWMAGPSLPVEKVGEITTEMEERGIPMKLPRPTGLREEVLDHDGPEPLLTIEQNGMGICGLLQFKYGGKVVDFDPSYPEVFRLVEKEILWVVERCGGDELAAAEILKASDLQPIADSNPILDDGSEWGNVFVANRDSDQQDAFWVAFSNGEVPRLEGQGWEVVLSPDLDLESERIDEIDVEITSESPDEIDWFQFDVGVVTTDGQRESLLEKIANFLESGAPIPPDHELLDSDRIVLRGRPGEPFLDLPARRFYHIVRSVRDLFKRPTEDLHRVEAACLADELDVKATGTLADLRLLGKQLREQESHEPSEFPTLIQAELRDYQKEGFQWLQFLAKYRLHGILADDMGLGKTLQTLTHLAAEVESGRARSAPSLVVAPTSVVPNWAAETKKFAPGLKVLTLHGPKRKGYFLQIKNADLVVTSYALLGRDEDIHKTVEYHVVVLDEAQYIKNPDTKVSSAACDLKARHRICLSGTPMENHLGELWSLFRFLMPGLLGTRKKFGEVFRTPIEKHQDRDAQRALNSRVANLILRRTKDQVVQELPEKTEILHRIPLNKQQQEIYESVRSAMDERIREAIASKGLARSQIVVLDALLKLRQICCHPRLIKTDIAKKAKDSAKLDALVELLDTLVGEGRRILIFSQFTTMLAMIEEHLEKSKIDFVQITGATKDRKTPVEKFQEGKIPVFLISLKAGGTGLNLTAADTVIHYDPWWNPAAENQATDRAHRIGQKNPVFVHKLISEGTIEERIVDLQTRKSKLVEALLDEKTSKLQLDPETLGNLLAPIG